jgi:hypothetical protein
VRVLRRLFRPSLRGAVSARLQLSSQSMP